MTKFGLLTALSLVACALPALAQRQADPNMGHFYMARQQITITDEAPAVNDQRTNPQPGGAGMGGLPNRPIGLPRAGWMPYSQSVPGLRTDLPRTNNGVPEKAPPPSPSAMRAQAARMKASAPKPAKTSQPAGPVVVKAYTPYKQYAPDSAAAGSAALGANSNVRGSVLHWARPRRNY